PQGKPFTSDLSGQDFYVLLSMGYIPRGLVMGSCVYHVAHQGLRQSFKTMGNNIEMSNYTQALYDARELAMERMQMEAEEAQAEGIVGVQIKEQSHGWGSHVIEYFAVGTAVIPRAVDHPIPEPTIVLGIND
ncbi:MAG: heavy metal-binding domain-containing protein, partial [Chloroflexi bacterium]|nr:heavy metal-binding domain-containing protein [Chloroflexota bacterium]